VSLRFTHLTTAVAAAVLCLCAPTSFAGAGIDFAEGEFELPEADADVVEDEFAIRELTKYQQHLVYSEDWSGGTGGWSTQASILPGRAPVRIPIGHPLAQWGMYFWGNNGWAIRGGTLPDVPVKVSIIGYVLSANRNALSVNVRTRGGGAIYKYGFCGGVIGANKQPPTWTYRDTDLGYRTETPYELYSIWIPNTGRFAIGLKNLITGEERMSRYLWSCMSWGNPGGIDFDQEAGGKGPAVLGRVAVYVLQ
jgi:hypothetical protein